MNRERLQYLFERRYNASITDAEASELQAFLLADDNKELLEECISEYLNLPPDVPLPDDGVIENLLSRILQNKEEQPTIPKARRVHLYLKWAVAAMLLLSVGWTVWHFINSKHLTDPINITATTKDISPGHNGAVLTLADGSTVLLDSAANGIVAIQGNAKAILKDQQLQYTNNGVSKDAAVYNTITTPKGRQFTLVLPDGTHVWLNAGSTLRFPTVFSESERSVFMDGEIYFEVAKNRQLPFRVHIQDKGQVEVLGTHFDINAYDNESVIKTSLLEGAVKVSDKHQNVVKIAPNQQAVWAASLPIKIIRHIDPDKILAWKNGLFDLEGLSFQEAMRQLERWYDIDVVYNNGKVPDIQFYGQIDKSVTLQGLLKALQLTDVNYTIQGRKLIISL